MPAQVLSWIQATEKIVGKGHPTLPDVENRPLRTLLTLVGQNPDQAFTGLVPVFNVKSYQAVGDNTTDDAATIQDAISAAQISGGEVYFPNGIYKTTAGLTITANGVTFRAANSTTYVHYSGTGYAISFSLAGAAQIHNCGIEKLGIVCSNVAGSGVYAKSPYGFYYREGYLENGVTSTTGVGITIDGGLSSGGSGYFATHNLISHVRCNGFLKGILFKGGSLSGWDITTASVVEHCFVNSLVGLAGSVGVEFQGAQQCTVLGGNLESLDRGIKLTSSPNRCGGIIIDSVRFEAIVVANWDIPSDTENTTIKAPKFEVDNGINAAPDTTIYQNASSLVNSVRRNPLVVACVNGDNNHTLSRSIGTFGNKTAFIKITGPTAAFNIGGFALETAGFAATDGMELIVYNTTAQQMTINNSDASAVANTSIRTPTGAAVVLPARFGGTSARFIYDAEFPQWILIGTQS